MNAFESVPKPTENTGMQVPLVEPCTAQRLTIEDQFLSVDLTVDRPVATLHAVSHDPSLTELVTLRSGRTLTAVQLQMEYAEQARKYVEDRYGSDADPVTVDVLDRWESVLSRLESDPMSLARELDWVAKLQILEGYRSRDGLDHLRPKPEP